MPSNDKILGLSPYIMPAAKSLKEQAAERGVPLPFGQTVDELEAQGYVVGHDIIGCAVVLEDAESPTGAVWRLRAEDLTRLIVQAKQDMKLQGRIVMRYNAPKAEGDPEVVEQPVLEPVITAEWMRQHKLPCIGRWLPNWAVVNHFHKTADGLHMDGVTFCPIEAIAPTAADFETEDERRGAAGLPPLQAWQRPTAVSKTWVLKEAKKITAEMLAVSASIDDIETFDTPGGPVHVDVKNCFATTESFNEALANMPPDDDGKDE